MKRLILISYILFTNLVNAQWQPLSTGLGIGWGTNCFTTYNSKLIVGGYFQSAGGNNADNIAAWDGTSWSNLSTGLQGGLSGIGLEGVCALAVYNNELYAGGTFSACLTSTLNNFAKWNGTSWSGNNLALNGSTLVGSYSCIRALTIFNGELITAGDFAGISGIQLNNIGKWNGVNWTPLGSGIERNGTYVYGGTVRALTVYNNELYAGGSFTIAGGVAVTNIAKWNGTSWSAVGTGIPLSPWFYTAVSCLHVFNNELYAGNVSSGISKWNGTNWSTVGGGLSGPPLGYGQALSMTIYNNKLIVGGTFALAGLQNILNIAAWDGTNWYFVGGFQDYNGVDGSVKALGVYNSCLYSGGEFTIAWDSPDILNLNRVAKFCGTVGIEEYNDKRIVKISPNPSAGKFNFEGLISKSKIQVYDISAKLIYSENSIEEKCTIDLSKFDKGIYFYKIISNENKILQGKLIKD